MAALIVAAIVPVAVGLVCGKIAYETTDGRSMLPLYHTGDLVIVEKDSHYRVGEIVAYEGGPNGHTMVLHRIIGGDSAHGFIVKGDNNQSTDPTRPTPPQVIGRAVVRIPKVGALVQNPVTRGIVALLAMTALASLFGKSPRSSRRVARKEAVRGTRRTCLTVLAVVDATLIAALALSLAVPNPPAAASGTPLTQTISLGYHASTVPTAAYPTGRLDTGDPIFLRLVQRLDVSFSYSTPATGVGGTARVDAVASSANGWKTTLPIVAPSALHNLPSALGGVLDLSTILDRAVDVSRATGVSTGTLNVDLVATVTPTVAGVPAHQLQDKLSLQLNPLEAALSKSQVSATGSGPAVVSTIPLTSIPLPSNANTSPGSVQIRIGLLVALLVALVVTAMLWPTKPAEDAIAPTEILVAGAFLPELPRVALESSEELREVAVRLELPILRKPDKWRAVITRDLIYWTAEPSGARSAGPT